MQRVGATTAVVLLRHRTGVLTPAAVRHSKTLAKGEVPVSEAIVDAALRQEQAIAVADVRDDGRFANRESVVLYDADQVLCVPIGAKAPFVGVLYVNRPSASEEPVEALLDISTAITQLLATGIQRFTGRASESNRVRRELERLYAPEVAERLSQHPAVVNSHLAEHAITFLAVDVAEFAEVQKKLEPAALAQALRDLAELFVRLVFSFEGSVESINAGLLGATFGTPTAKGDDAIRAVRCAMTLKTEWERTQASKPARERFSIRAGLATGKALVGTLGTSARIDACAVGEPVQLARWLSDSGAPGQILMTGKTLAQVGARFDAVPLGERPLLSSRQRTAVFEVLDEDSDVGTLSGVRRR
jgi:adenylate cyclase